MTDLKLLRFENRKALTDDEVLARIAEAMRPPLLADANADVNRRTSKRIAALGACLQRQELLLSSADFFNKDVVMYYLSIARALCERIQAELNVDNSAAGGSPPAA